jgi:hypothetical protein
MLSRAVVHAVLHAELDVQQAQEMPDLRRRAHRRLAPAAGQPLLDRDGRGNAVHRIDFRAARGLHDAARVRIERLEVAPLTFVEKDVERQRRLARPRYAGHHAELVVRDVDRQRLEVVLARIDDLDAGRRLSLGC